MQRAHARPSLAGQIAFIQYSLIVGLNNLQKSAFALAVKSTPMNNEAITAAIFLFMILVPYLVKCKYD
ncbi:hypothetical protein Xbed_02910 [Xenorhabdus beddingii]|uniref:Uncharacterized protein n=1 Tax=Xenorhabdus beddingii TaxID=40578 RepID=A0A1Y2SJ17_9GAMM|nr:hypothetical protein Xbed_02910 [Xenorhabdus beddingii]